MGGAVLLALPQLVLMFRGVAMLWIFWLAYQLWRAADPSAVNSNSPMRLSQSGIVSMGQSQGLGGGNRRQHGGDRAKPCASWADLGGMSVRGEPVCLLFLDQLWPSFGPVAKCRQGAAKFLAHYGDGFGGFGAVDFDRTIIV